MSISHFQEVKKDYILLAAWVSRWQKCTIVFISFAGLHQTQNPCSLVSPMAQLSSVQLLSGVWLLRPHESQHSRPPCPSPTPGVFSNPCPSTWWCHPATSSSVVPFSSCPQSLPASGSFPMSQVFAWGGQIWGFSVRISPSNEHPGLISFRMDWLDPLQSKGLSRFFSNTTVQKHQFSALSFLHSPSLTSIHDHWKNHSLD